MKLQNLSLIVGLAWAISAGAAEAITVTTSGTWENVTTTGGTNISGEGTSQISWGTPWEDEQSSYVFEGINESNVDVNELIDENFLVGEFTHNNFPITGTLLDTTTLAIELGIDGFYKTFNFDVDHFETPNSPGSGVCAAGGSMPCPDEVTFNEFTSEEFITLENVDYRLNLFGFSQDDGVTVTDNFLTLEGRENTAGLYARLLRVETPAEAVPEPASLLGLIAVGGMASVLKRRQQLA